MERPTGAGEGQGLSPPVVRALDSSLHVAQFTPEQWGLIEVEQYISIVTGNTYMWVSV
jgi:hypothetical protein